MSGLASWGAGGLCKRSLCLGWYYDKLVGVAWQPGCNLPDQAATGEYGVVGIREDFRMG